MRIGFVDHHLNNFHANKFLALLRGPLQDQGAEVVAAWESHPTGEDWCQKNQVPRLASAAAVAEKCDAVIVLAPDSIDSHLDLCRAVFPAGKPCMVDKFLSNTASEARQIVELAHKHNVRIFSASSLRFAVELKAALAEVHDPIPEAWASGMGLWGGYGVHTLSLVLGVLGPGVKRLLDAGVGATTQLALDYGGDRRGFVSVRSAANQGEALPWTFGFRVGDQVRTGTVRDYDGFYANLMRETVRFFRTGTSPVTEQEMLVVPAILERAVRSREAGGAWLPVEG